MASSHFLNKLSSSFSMVPSLPLTKPSSSITSKILNKGKIANVLPGAFATILASNGYDIIGVLCLAKGLRKVKSAYPLVVAVLPGAVQEGDLQRLESLGCILTEIQPLYPKKQSGCSHIDFSKLRLWDLDGFEKLVFLDSNVQVYGNIDELFDYPEAENLNCGMLYAVLDCCCDNPQYNINLCQEKLYFNDGVFLFEPSKKTFNYLVETFDLDPPTPTPFAVQDFLNKVFKKDYNPISLIFNLNLPMLWNHSEHVVDVDRVKVIHYCAQGSQPWSYTGDEENMQREDVKLLVKKWWDVCNDESLDYEPPAQEDN